MWRRLVFSRLLVINVVAVRADPGQTKTIHCAAMASRATRTNTAAADSSSKDDRPTPSWDTSPRQRVPFLRDMERLDYLFSLVTGLRSVFTTGTASRRGRTVCESEAHILHIVNNPGIHYTWVQPSPTGGYPLAAPAPSGAPAPAPAPASASTAPVNAGRSP